MRASGFESARFFCGDVSARSKKELMRPIEKVKTYLFKKGGCS
ncbi:hypothetical protein L479_01464 [Exiguobacterium sp. S17]|nr:hypothetical protein L479_01464 [Exiguobacterium sp. S17]